MKMHRGDEFKLPIMLKNRGTVLTPSMIDGLKIKVADIELTYNGIDGISFDDEEGVWLFPLTQEQTLQLQSEKYKDMNLSTSPDFDTNIPVQAQIKLNGEVFGTDVDYINVKDSIIKTVWDSNE